MARVPLTRPDPPERPRRPWPTPSVAVFGEDEVRLAEALLESWPEARRLDVALRHAPGYDLGDGRIDAHPDALREALDALPVTTPTVGIGAAFAAAVEADVTVFVGPLEGMLGLPPAVRAAARAATLHLATPRPEALRELGRRLRDPSEPR